MRVIRNWSATIAAVTIGWHVVAVVLLSTALTCVSASSGRAELGPCPMHKAEPECALHASETRKNHPCDCPTVGCSKTDLGFLSLFSSVGVMPSATGLPERLDRGQSVVIDHPIEVTFAFIPATPPPRS